MRKLVLVLLLTASCDAEPVPPPPKRAPDPRDVIVPAPQAAHHPDAPHGGTLVELGEHVANLELLLDASTGTVTAYVLDGHADQAVRLEQKEIVLQGKPLSVTLQAVGSPLTGETPGNTSQFQGQSEVLKGAKEFDGTVVRVVVKGREFSNVPLRLQPLRKQD
jgi:hypothetical protein